MEMIKDFLEACWTGHGAVLFMLLVGHDSRGQISVLRRHLSRFRISSRGSLLTPSDVSHMTRVYPLAGPRVCRA
jgi:hypothetical protein